MIKKTYCHALGVCADDPGCLELLLVGVNLALGFFNDLLDLFDLQTEDGGDGDGGDEAKDGTNLLAETGKGYIDLPPGVGRSRSSNLDVYTP